MDGLRVAKPMYEKYDNKDNNNIGNIGMDLFITKLCPQLQALYLSIFYIFPSELCHHQYWVSSNAKLGSIPFESICSLYF